MCAQLLGCLPGVSAYYPNLQFLYPNTSAIRTPHKSGHLTNQDTSAIRTPHNQDTSQIRTPQQSGHHESGHHKIRRLSYNMLGAHQYTTGCRHTLSTQSLCVWECCGRKPLTWSEVLWNQTRTPRCQLIWPAFWGCLELWGRSDGSQSSRGCPGSCERGKERRRERVTDWREEGEKVEGKEGKTDIKALLPFHFQRRRTDGAYSGMKATRACKTHVHANWPKAPISHSPNKRVCPCIPWKASKVPPPRILLQVANYTKAGCPLTEGKASTNQHLIQPNKLYHINRYSISATPILAHDIHKWWEPSL